MMKSEHFTLSSLINLSISSCAFLAFPSSPLLSALFLSDDWREWMEGTPDSITQPVVEKNPTTCQSCNSKVTAKMKFCGDCGEKI